MNLSSILLWGFAATAILTTMTAAAQALGLTRIDIPFILGTMWTPDRDRAAHDPLQGIQQQLHCSSQSFSISERMMSPLISIRPFSAPRPTRFGCFAMGSTRAIGSPLNVTVNGFPFFCTSFSILIHFALNSEIRTVFISKY